MTGKNERIKDKRIYFFLKPSKIYNTQGLNEIFKEKDEDIKNVGILVSNKKPYNKKGRLRKKSPSSSSKWATIEQILKVAENLEIQENDKKNVWIVPREKVKDFFESTFLPNYRDEIEKSLVDVATEIVKSGSNNSEINKNKLRNLFRENIFNKLDHCCHIKNCKITFEADLIASHIWPVNKILKDRKLDKKEKERQIIDINNGFLFCRNHDLLFDKFYVSFNKNGKLETSEEVKEYLKEFELDENTTYIDIRNNENRIYLKKHFNNFKSIHNLSKR